MSEQFIVSREALRLLKEHAPLFDAIKKHDVVNNLEELFHNYAVEELSPYNIVVDPFDYNTVYLIEKNGYING